ncbi:hypothetical protein L195_g063702, partial [Trifolium pratense]
MIGAATGDTIEAAIGVARGAETEGGAKDESLVA